MKKKFNAQFFQLNVDKNLKKLKKKLTESK